MAMDSVAGSVIQASGMVVFEDVLRTWPGGQTFSQPTASALALVSIWHHKRVKCGLTCCANSKKAILSKNSTDQIPICWVPGNFWKEVIIKGLSSPRKLGSQAIPLQDPRNGIEVSLVSGCEQNPKLWDTLFLLEGRFLYQLAWQKLFLVVIHQK